MKKFFVAGVAAGTVLTFVPGANAAHRPQGDLCGLTSVSVLRGCWYTGEIYGGPLVIDDVRTGQVESGSLTGTD